MASTSTVYVPIQSFVGFKRPDGAARGGYSAPRPVLQTTETLDGDTFAITGVTANSKMLYVPPVPTFTYFPNTTSTTKVVTVLNSGTSAIVLLGTTSTDYETTAIVDIGTLPATISAGGSYTFNLSYYATTVGEYPESLLLISTADVPYYRIDTLQNVISVFGVRPSSTSTSVTTTVLGESYTTTIDLIPIVNGVDDYERPINFTTSMSGSNGWTVASGSNLVNINWDPDIESNINNTTTGYISTLTIAVEGIADTIKITNTAFINIDYTRYRNLATWFSAASSNNSFIGVSFDIFDGVKTVTIGVGAGGDGTPIYEDGGNLFATMKNLSIGAGTIEPPYPYWSTVCSIPIPEAGTYLSGALNANDVPLYLKKTTDGLNYADYFGFEQGVGSMFIVNYDGFNTVTIELNNLRELSGDVDFDETLNNITRAFHYYSDVDVPARYYQLETFNPDDPRTHLFRGFIASFATNPEIWSVDVSTVPLPT
jgi:hypothetical protein